MQGNPLIMKDKASKNIPSMKLEKFVSETLLQVINGVQEAQNALYKQGSTAEINPAIGHANSAHFNEPITLDTRKILPMKFDVSVTVQDEQKTGADIGIVVGSIRLGALGASKESNNIFSRIQFEVPVSLPTGPIKDS